MGIKGDESLPLFMTAAMAAVFSRKKQQEND